MQKKTPIYKQAQQATKKKENQANQPSYVRVPRATMTHSLIANKLRDQNAEIPPSPFLQNLLTQAWEFQGVTERSVSRNVSKPEKNGKINLI